jgi:hypothetical protein
LAYAQVAQLHFSRLEPRIGEFELILKAIQVLLGCGGGSKRGVAGAGGTGGSSGCLRELGLGFLVAGGSGDLGAPAGGEGGLVVSQLLLQLDYGWGRTSGRHW